MDATQPMVSVPVPLELVDILDEARHPREDLETCLRRLVLEGFRRIGNEDAVDRTEALGKGRGAPPRLALTDSEFAGLLTDDWLRRKQVAAVLAGRDGSSVRAAQRRIRDIIARHGLAQLTSAMPSRDCGLFEAKVGRGGGLQFRRQAS